MNNRRDCKLWLLPECQGCPHLRKWTADDETPIEQCAVLAYRNSDGVWMPDAVVARIAPRPPPEAMVLREELSDWWDSGNWLTKRPCPIRGQP